MRSALAGLPRVALLVAASRPSATARAAHAAPPGIDASGVAARGSVVEVALTPSGAFEGHSASSDDVHQPQAAGAMIRREGAVSEPDDRQRPHKTKLNLNAQSRLEVESGYDSQSSAFQPDVGSTSMALLMEDAVSRLARNLSTRSVDADIVAATPPTGPQLAHEATRPIQKTSSAHAVVAPPRPSPVAVSPAVAAHVAATSIRQLRTESVEDGPADTPLSEPPQVPTAMTAVEVYAKADTDLVACADGRMMTRSHTVDVDPCFEDPIFGADKTNGTSKATKGNKADLESEDLEEVWTWDKYLCVVVVAGCCSCALVVCVGLLGAKLAGFVKPPIPGEDDGEPYAASMPMPQAASSGGY